VVQSWHWDRFPRSTVLPRLDVDVNSGERQRHDAQGILCTYLCQRCCMLSVVTRKDAAAAES
jgi:hypothetical protein